MKGIIYYTDSRIEDLEHDRVLPTLVRKLISDSELPITSCSLKPLDFGTNIVLDEEPGVITMYKQILTALQNAKEKYIFFCEHDVLYHPSHFDFTPPRDDTFYYNTNAWKCHPRQDIAITYDHLISVSGICVNREKAIEHYEKRIQYCYDKGFDKLPSRNPKWARVMGYEPGKKVRIGGFLEEPIEEWKSEFPNVDIRHYRTMTAAKLHLEQFAHKPTGWVSTTVDKIPGWDIKKLFNI